MQIRLCQKLLDYSPDCSLQLVSLTSTAPFEYQVYLGYLRAKANMYDGILRVLLNIFRLNLTIEFSYFVLALAQTEGICPYLTYPQIRYRYHVQSFDTSSCCYFGTFAARDQLRMISS